MEVFKLNIAFIPVRGGSKSIPLKNIRYIGGRPLVYWVIKAASECNYIDKIYVATDSMEIKKTVEDFSSEIEKGSRAEILIIGRSEESASDTASTEFAMLEFARDNNFDNIVLIQATSPLLTGHDLDRGFEAFEDGKTDSVLSVVPQKRFVWEKNPDGFSKPINYDLFHRPRRQEFDGYLVENGAFYITSKEALMRSHNRVSGNIKTVEMGEDSYWEIDEPEDWILIENLLEKKKHADIMQGIPKIKLFLSDCDGCMTDGGMYYSEKGDEMKKFNTKDGVGFSLLRNEGILTGIVTGENVELNCRRAKKIKVDILERGCIDKLAVINKICLKLGIALENVAYVGDDINDLEVIRKVGFGCCPSDACEQVKRASAYIAHARGGEGVIREVAEIIVGQNKCGK